MNSISLKYQAQDITTVLHSDGFQVSFAIPEQPTLANKSSFSVSFEERHASTGSIYKRLLDIFGSLVGLIIYAVVYLPVAIAIQLDDPGEVFFTQERYGLYGCPIKIRKFRSMVANAEELKHLVENQAKGHIFKNENDPRITRVGRFLRRTSLDELPQFWNVLMGDMSLVGTRPPTVDEVQKYKTNHWERLKVKPGITGAWQANGRSKVNDFEDIVCLDLDYQQRWSIGYDLWLIVKTIYVVLTRNGAV